MKFESINIFSFDLIKLFYLSLLFYCILINFINLFSSLSFGRSADRSLAIISGAIFNDEQKNSPIELAFKYAVYKINKDKIILPRTTLVYDIQYVPKDDSFHASKKGKIAYRKK